MKSSATQARLPACGKRREPSSMQQAVELPSLLRCDACERAVVVHRGCMTGSVPSAPRGKNAFAAGPSGSVGRKGHKAGVHFSNAWLPAVTWSCVSSCADATYARDVQAACMLKLLNRQQQRDVEKNQDGREWRDMETPSVSNREQNRLGCE
eukprot:362713-Chlamydomonas_euryale.AAC.7